MLYGVRFGPTTRYCVLDVDKGSAYHPTRDRFAWRRLIAALEVLGLVQAVVCTSSYSGGLHLYFPFDTEQKTWAIALAVSTLLENSGFKLAPDSSKSFPTAKPMSPVASTVSTTGIVCPCKRGLIS
jgi:DNA primase